MDCMYSMTCSKTENLDFFNFYSNIEERAMQEGKVALSANGVTGAGCHFLLDSHVKRSFIFE